MRAKLMLLTVLVLLFLAFVVVKFFILDSQSVFGRLKVDSSPTTSVFVNNVAVGKTPFEDKFKAGDYILKLIPEGTASDTVSWQGKIKIYRNARTYVNRELGSSDLTSAGEIFTITKTMSGRNADYGEIAVDTEPQGAIVYLDNDEKGVAPLILQNVLKGDHELSIFMPGFLRRSRKVNVEAGFRVNTIFKLAIDQSQQTATGSAATTKTASASASTKKVSVLIKDTPTGFLRVREGPTTSASESGRVKPGERFLFLEEKDGWYKIQYDEGKEGWVSGQYAEKKEE